MVQTKEREIMNDSNNKSMIDIFIDLLLIIKTQGSSYLLEKMPENEMISSDKLKFKKLPYFVYLIDENDLCDSDYSLISENYEELSKNDWELHKKLISEGVNPNEIAKIIRNDEIEKLQEISSQNEFDFNQFIEPSLYERCDFINKEDVSLLDYAAFFGSIKCFRYLLLNCYCNHAKTGKYAAAGGNLEMIHLCEQNHLSFDDSCDLLIMLHRNDVFIYLYENKLIYIKNLTLLGDLCISHNNFEIFSFLESEGMEINKSMIITAIQTGNLLLLKHLLQKMPVKTYVYEILKFSGKEELFNYLRINKYIKFKYKEDDCVFSLEFLINAKDKIYFNNFLFQNNIWKLFKLFKTALMLASKNGHTETVKLLLEQEGIDINAKDVDGYTALIRASSEGYTETVKLLLEQKGIDINAKDDKGMYLFMRLKDGLILAIQK